MQSHATGNIEGNRRGALSTFQTFKFKYGVDVSAAAKKLCKILASVDKPAYFRVTANVATAFDSVTTAVLSVGTNASSYNNHLNGVDIKATAGTNYANTNPWKKLTADTDLYGLITLTGTTTTGQVDVLVEVIDMNNNEP